MKNSRIGRAKMTIIGIAVGVFAVVAISTIGTVGTNKVTQILTEMGINSVLVQPNEREVSISFKDEDIKGIGSVSGIKKAMPLMSVGTSAKLAMKQINCLAWGIDRNAAEIINLEAVYGRLITSGDVAESRQVCVIDEDIALKTYGRSNVIGKKIEVALGGVYRQYEIVGIAKSGISTLQSAFAGIIPTFLYLPYTTVQTATGRTGFDKIAVLLNEENAAETTTLISNKINSMYNITSGINVSSLLAQKEQMEGIMGGITLLLSLIASISLLVSGIMVMTTMTVAVRERTREIGIKKAVGASFSDIFKEFLLESIAISISGTVLGTGAGLLCTFVACLIMGLTFSVNMQAIAVTFIVSLIMGIVFGVKPAMNAATLKPIEAVN